jgi:predicted PurR-regulated permease PerM
MLCALTGSSGEAVTVRTLFLAGLSLLGVVGAALLAWSLLHVVLIVLTAVVLGEGLRPAVEGPCRRGMPYAASIAAVYLALAAIGVSVLALLTEPIAGQAGAVVAALPSYQHAVRTNVDLLLTSVHIDAGTSSQVVGGLVGELSRVAMTVVAAGGRLVAAVSDVTAVVLLSVTWLAVRPDLHRWLLDLVPHDRRAEVQQVVDAVSATFAGYVRGVCVNMVAIGMLAWLACWLLGLPVPVLLGIVAGACELIPLLGPFLGAVPAVALGFTVSAWYPLAVAAAFLVIQQVESNVLTPLVMRRQVGLRPFPLLVSLLVGGSLAGLWGAVVAVPVGSALRVVVLRVVAPAVRARAKRPPRRRESAG